MEIKLNTITIDYTFKYQVEAIIEGGMGRVLILNRLSEASPYDLLHRKKLAAKTFKNEEFVEENKEMLERELRIWIELDFPNIAKLLKVVFINNNLFAIMPFYNSNLRKIIENNKNLELQDAKLIIINIIYALYNVYKKYRIIHQDLKPENVLIDIDFDKGERHFYVSDWGIANIQEKYCSNAPKKDWLPPSFVETMRGMGTLPYMSPERFLGHRSDIRFDIFSIGMIFFELLFGQLPYNFLSKKPLISQILDGDYFYLGKDLLNRNYDEKVTHVILKCINPNPKERYNDYGKLVMDVDNLNRRKN